MATANTEFARIDSVEEEKVSELLNSSFAPKVTAEDNGKILKVVNGKWELAEGNSDASAPVLEPIEPAPVAPEA